MPFWGQLAPTLFPNVCAVHNSLTYSLVPTDKERDDHDLADRSVGCLSPSRCLRRHSEPSLAPLQLSLSL